MKKFDLKSVFVGLISGVIIVCGASIASTLVTGDVYFSSYPIYINGSYYTTSSPLLNYNGRTYVPLNEFGTMVGSNVNFANNTIYISKQYDYNYDNNYNSSVREEDFEISVDDSEEYYISLARYGAKSATVTTTNSCVKLSKTKFTSSGDLKITGKKEGDTIVKITYSTGDIEKLYVEVFEDEEDDEVSIKTGDTYKVYIDLDDFDSDSAKVTYDSNYVKVSKTTFTSNGYLTITAKKEGDTTVKIKYDSGDTEYIYLEIDGDSYSDNYDEIEVAEDDYEYVYIDLDEFDATSATLTYNSSYIKLNKTTLTESGKVKITGKNVGYTSIKVKFNTGDIVYIDVEVTD